MSRGHLKGFCSVDVDTLFEILIPFVKKAGGRYEKSKEVRKSS